MIFMPDSMLQNLTRQKWYRWSIYINVILFFIIALFVVLLVIDSYNAGMTAQMSTASTHEATQAMLLVARDIGFLAVALAFVFFQFFRNLMMIIRRTL